MEEIRVLVVDDHSLFRQGVIQTLRQEPDMTVVGEAGSAAAAVDKARDVLADVVLLDLKLPDGSGLTVARELQRQCPFSKVIVLTVVEDDEALLQALKEGARGYLLKGVSGEELVRVIRAVQQGETYVTPSMASRLLSELAQPEAGRLGRSLGDDLTERERTILELVAQGLTNKEIAGRLHLSEKTVKHYMTNILQKLHVRNRVEAALLAAKEQAPF
jgi:DNA-binding NarL/FixJ family response regulator